MAFTCPACGRVSNNPQDEAQGYCGACHGWTQGRDDRGLLVYTQVRTGDYACPECGARVLVPPDYPGPVLCACGPPGRQVLMMEAVQFEAAWSVSTAGWSSTDSGGTRRENQSPAGYFPDDDGGIAWDVPFEWHAGDPET